MGIDDLLTPTLWGFVALAHVLLYLAPRVPRTRRFAVLNIVGIAVLCGPDAAALLLGLALAMWGVLRPATVIRARGVARERHLLGVLALVTLSAVFIAYKLYAEAWLWTPGDGRAPAALETVYGVLRTVSFSYVFLRGVDLVRCVIWGDARLLDPLALTGYLGPFHMLVAGPITPYADFLAVDDHDRAAPSFRRVVRACQLIVSGLFCKIVIAQALRQFLFGLDGAVVSQHWFDTAYLLVYVYFDFAGYSLIAFGIGSLLEIPTPKNFERPYLATSVTDFWARWHTSLGQFVRSNLYLPLQLALARRCRRGAWVTLVSVLPLAVAFLFVAVWHRMTTDFLLWGVLMAVVLVIEKLLQPTIMSRLRAARRGWRIAGRVAGPVYALLTITTSIHLVAAEVFG